MSSSASMDPLLPRRTKPKHSVLLGSVFSGALLAVIASGPVLAQDFAIQPLTEGVTVETTPAPNASTPAPAGGAGVGTDPATALETPAEPAAPQVDESALRYYAQTGRYDRLELEINRLRTLYPDWTPPADLFAPGGGQQAGPDETPLWSLLSNQDFAGFDAALQQFSAQHPGWTPPEAMMRERGLSQSRLTVTEAGEAGNWQAVLDAGRANPGLLGCSDPQSTWYFAEAQVKAGQDIAGARETLASLMRSCRSYDVRVATLQKAAALLPWEDVQTLRTLEATASGGSAEESGNFDQVFADLGRGRLADKLADETATVTEDEVRAFEEIGESSRDAGTASLLGWYFLRQEEPNRADVWFRRSLEWGYSDSAAEGLVRTRLQQGDRDAALTIVEQYEDRTPGLREVWREGSLANIGSLSREDRRALANTIVEERNSEGASQFGWRAYRGNRFEDSARWFERSVAWGRSADVEGLILSYMQLGRGEEARALIDKWSKWQPKLQQYLGGAGGGLVAEAGDQARQENYAECLRLVDEARAAGTYTMGMANQRGWCLLGLDRPTEAKQSFQDALALPAPQFSLADESRTARQDTTSGILWSLLAMGMSAQVLDYLQTADLSEQDRQLLHGEAITRLALSAYEMEDWREALRLLDYRNQLLPRTRGLTELEAWAYYNINNRSKALELFEMLDDQLSTPETQNALAVVRGVAN